MYSDGVNDGGAPGEGTIPPPQRRQSRANGIPTNCSKTCKRPSLSSVAGYGCLAPWALLAVS